MTRRDRRARRALAAGAERASDAAERRRNIVAEELEGADAHEPDEGDQERIFDQAGSPLTRHEPRLQLLKQQRHDVPFPPEPRPCAAISPGLLCPWQASR